MTLSYCWRNIQGDLRKLTHDVVSTWPCHPVNHLHGQSWSKFGGWRKVKRRFIYHVCVTGTRQWCKGHCLRGWSLKTKLRLDLSMLGTLRTMCWSLWLSLASAKTAVKPIMLTQGPAALSDAQILTPVTSTTNLQLLRCIRCT